MEDDNQATEDESVRQDGCDDDAIIWIGRPSQWVNAPTILLSSVVIAVIVVLKDAYDHTRYSWKYREYEQPLEYMVYLIIAFMVFRIVLRVLSVYYTRYELSDERLIEYSGITKIFENGEPLELYNVYDYQFPPPILLAVLGRGSLRLLTHDANQPEVYLRAIKNRHSVYEMIRSRVERLRMSKKGYFT